MQRIRVFPRRTKYTPADLMAFVGFPPLIRPQADVVDVSVTFTWDMKRGEVLAAAWSQYYDYVRLGGPAYHSACGSFTHGLYIGKRGVTFTSRGCNNQCPWCLVPAMEGNLKPLKVTSGYDVQDNNLLQNERFHVEKVMAMLRSQRHAVSFSGGLDTSLIRDWLIDDLCGLKVDQLFLACDTKEAIRPLRAAMSLLKNFPRRKTRCYVLLAHNGETLTEAQDRLEEIWECGCLPFAQLYQPPDKYIDYPYVWLDLARLWSRPAAMFSTHGNTNRG